MKTENNPTPVNQPEPTENQPVETEIDLNIITQLPGIVTDVRTDVAEFKTQMTQFMAEIRDELKSSRRLKIISTNSPINKLTKKEQIESELNNVITSLK